jgi:hypothetical protein
VNASQGKSLKRVVQYGSLILQLRLVV